MSTDSKRLAGTAWLIVALLFPVALLNYLDRQMIAAMKMSVMRDLTSIGSDANWGYMLGLFKWVYAGLSPLGGYVAARFSRKHVVIGSLAVWSLVTLATGHVTNYSQLLAARSLMGISEAFYFPAALALISDFHAGSTRSRAVGIHQIGIYLGVITGGFSGYIAQSDAFGWRFAFNACGLAGIAYVLPLLLFLRNAPRATGLDVPRISPGKAFGELLSNGAFLLLVLYFTLPAIAGWVVRDWMPAILQRQFNITQGIAGVSATLYVNIAAIGGAIFGGWLADRWMRVRERGRIYVSALGMAMIIPALFGIGHASALLVAIGFLVLFGLGWGFFDCNNMPILCQITRPGLRATGYGIMNFVSISIGGLADWHFGAMRDRNVPLSDVFGFFAGAAVLSLVVVLCLRPRQTGNEANS